MDIVSELSTYGIAVTHPAVSDFATKACVDSISNVVTAKPFCLEYRLPSRQASETDGESTITIICASLKTGFIAA
ncbi:MAG: hypothetical protein R3F37_03465 [Candidatus Competibacteraceae bacterium]